MCIARQLDQILAISGYSTHYHCDPANKEGGGGKRCTNKKRFVLNGFQRLIAAGLSQQSIILYFRIRIRCLCIISYYNKQIQLFFSHFSNIFSLWGYFYPGIGYWIRCDQEQSTAQNFFCIQTELLFGK